MGHRLPKKSPPAREWLYGRQAVYEALRANRRRFYRLWVAESARLYGRLDEIVNDWAPLRGLTPEFRPREELTAQVGHEHHQGVLLEAGPYPYEDFPRLLENVHERPEPAFLLLLDRLQDPRNVGAVLRTAEAVGVHGVVLPYRQRAGITPTVVHVSAGASEHLPVATMNLAQAMERLKQTGIWVLGLDASPEARPWDPSWAEEPLALVVGSEGEGLRPLVREKCDVLLRLPMYGRVASLNAAVAASVALYLVRMAREASSVTPQEDT